MLHLRALVVLVAATSCVDLDERPELADQPPLQAIPLRGGPDGTNCSPAIAWQRSASGGVETFQTMLAHLYQVADLERAEVDGRVVFAASLPEPYASDLLHIEQLRKLAPIMASDSEVLYAEGDDYYDGEYGFASAELPDGLTCDVAFDDDLRTVGLMAHTALSQEGQCRTTPRGPQFWEVGPLFLLLPGDVYRVVDLVDMGVARWTVTAMSRRCIYPLGAAPSDGPVPFDDPLGPDHEIPCLAEFEDDVVTEAVALPLYSQEVVDGIPVVRRVFTAAGFEAMPESVAAVRTVLRDEWLRAMAAVGLPVVRPVPSASDGALQVVVVGHRVGPVVDPSDMLRPEERAQVDGLVGLYRERCCRLECGLPTETEIDRGTMTAHGRAAHCEEVCEPEGTCATAIAGGMSVLVNGATAARCDRDCPLPSEAAPDALPACGGEVR
jgi:hypothetical protein